MCVWGGGGGGGGNSCLWIFVAKNATLVLYACKSMKKQVIKSFFCNSQ